jgi:hypothetical protein
VHGRTLIVLRGHPSDRGKTQIGGLPFPDISENEPDHPLEIESAFSNF